MTRAASPAGEDGEVKVLGLSGQALAAARAPTGDDLLAILGRHAEAEAMTAAAHQSGRLKGALHDEAPRQDAAQANSAGRDERAVLGEEGWGVNVRVSTS
jgi:hypothetical protein